MGINISEITIHVPAVHREPFRVLDTTAAQEQFLAVPEPWPIGIRFESPKLTGNPLDQLKFLGQAALNTLVACKPVFHKSLLDGKLIQTEATTIVITSYDQDDSVIFATWDFGEPFDEAFSRLAEIRRTLRLPELTAKEYMHNSVQHLPPPQLVLSNVAAVGIEDPITNLGNYGNGIPMILAVGSKYTHLVVDHRIYTPKNETMFLEVFKDNLR